MSLLNKLKSSFVSKKKIFKISFIGLDQAGKSSVIQNILSNSFDETVNKRTLGMDVAKFEINGLSFVAWDIGGQKGFRETVWQSYLQGSKGIIFVIDSADRVRLKESRLEFEKHIINNSLFQNVPVLILANKQDKENALTIKELNDFFNIQFIEKLSIKIFPISCKSGLNINSAFDWLWGQIFIAEQKNMTQIYSAPRLPIKI